VRINSHENRDSAETSIKVEIGAQSTDLCAGQLEEREEGTAEVEGSKEKEPRCAQRQRHAAICAESRIGEGVRAGIVRAGRGTVADE